MIFWLSVVILTLASILAVAVPFLRGKRETVSALDHDREIYRARLDEIDADVSIGRLAPDEADAARAEEGRKLLAFSGNEGGKAQKADGSAGLSPKIALIAALLFVPSASLFFYLVSGVPGMPDMAIAERSNVDPANQSMEQLLARAEARLSQAPDDVRGWRVVGPVYLRLGRTADAVTAFRNALRLEPQDNTLRIDLGEAIVANAQGVVNEEARKLFEQALADTPGNAKARFYLAIAMTQQGEFAEAESAWNELISDAPADAPWMEAARAQLAQAREKQGKTAIANDKSGVANNETRSQESASLPAPGPSQEDIEAAAELSQGDRQAMIENMVAGLAERLQEEPDDKPGWIRLIRSYTVLGKPQEARQALASARQHFAEDAAFTAELDAIGETLQPGEDDS